jgi:hypothetical protein
MADALWSFQAELRVFGRADVSGRATIALQEAAQTTAEAVVIGNAFGPGTPLDTGFLRASFRVAKTSPNDGPSVRPPTPGRKDGDPAIYPNTVDTAAAAAAQLGDRVYVTTMAEYATYLEAGGMTRRNGPPENVGTPTPFVAPVEARWPQILDDAARRAGYGT